MCIAMNVFPGHSIYVYMHAILTSHIKPTCFVLMFDMDTVSAATQGTCIGDAAIGLQVNAGECVRGCVV